MHRSPGRSPGPSSGRSTPGRSPGGAPPRPLPPAAAAAFTLALSDELAQVNAFWRGPYTASPFQLTYVSRVDPVKPLAAALFVAMVEGRFAASRW